MSSAAFQSKEKPRWFLSLAEPAIRAPADDCGATLAWPRSPVRPLPVAEGAGCGGGATLLGPGDGDGITSVFRIEPGVGFFVKDADRKTLHAIEPAGGSPGFIQTIGQPGITRFDPYARYLASEFDRAESEVFESGNPRTHDVEVWFDGQDRPDWYVTDRFPLRDPAGRVSRLLVTMRSFEHARRFHAPFKGVARAVFFIRDNLHERLSVNDLARGAGMSVRQLHRAFCAAFGLNPRDFVAKTRLRAAMRTLLHTDRAIADIALDHGYCDQSAFTHQFRQSIDSTPLRFRRRFAV